MRQRWRLLAALVGVVAIVVVVIAVASGGDGAGPGARSATTAARAVAPQTWLAVSDVHFDPFDGATKQVVKDLASSPPSAWGAIFAKLGRPLSGYLADTNYALLQSALGSMQQNAASAPGVVIGGDFLAHDFQGTYNSLASDQSQQAYEAFVDKTIAFLAGQFGAALPNAQFIVTLGNNDSYCGDYASEPGSTFLSSFARAWA